MCWDNPELFGIELFFILLENWPLKGLMVTQRLFIVQVTQTSIKKDTYPEGNR
jgi:hypothetical protein